MAIDFPIPSSVGETFTEPTNGNVYICAQLSPAVWWGSVTTGNLDSIYLRLNAANDPLTGDLDTEGVRADGQVSGVQQSITTNTWDLSLGNYWTAGVIAVPQPINGVEGQSGLLTLTGIPSSWPATGGTLKYAGGSAPVITEVPAIVPFYVQSPTSVLLGAVTQDLT